jgi:Zn-dependent M28 family amino/carboxypeptidase
MVVALSPATASATDFYNSLPYRQIVTVPNILQHEQALQNIANANGGTRLAGTTGNVQTVDYIASTMTADGWAVQKQPFVFPYFQELAPSTFSQSAPTGQTFVNGTDFATMQYSGSGDVTANVTAVGPLNVPIGDTPAGTTMSGCAAADFAGFPVGNIALVQRGTCTFGTKATNAQAAGASGIVIFNEGQPGRTAAVAGTLGAPVRIPALGATYQLGVDTVTTLRGGQTVTWHITTSTISENRTTYNVIADSPWGDPNRTVVVSAHNDSVAAGPGINDDGSGISMDLELARQLGVEGQLPRNHVRFLWVGAEEEGLLGSNYYVSQLSAPTVRRSSRWSTSTWWPRRTTPARSTTATARHSAPTSPAPTALGSSRACSAAGSTAAARHTNRSRSTAARTTSRSPTPASRRVASSPAPKRSRRTTSS